MVCPHITIIGRGGDTKSLSQVIAGKVAGIAAGGVVSIFDNGGTTPIATAIVGVHLRWSADILLQHGLNVLQARVADAAGQVVASNRVEYDLVPVLLPPSHGTGGSYCHPGTFVFNASPGQATIGDSLALGRNHDGPELLPSPSASIAAMLHHVPGAGDVSLIGPDACTVLPHEGAARAEWHAHSAAFRFHP